MIYHYTSINNLALILSSNKFRFNRLDKVDDLTEGNMLPKHFRSYYFVSCWTQSSNENIPLWHMYTQMKGVKISFPQIPFKLHYIPKGNLFGVNITQEIYFPIAADELIQTDSKGYKFIFIPYETEFKSYPINYCSDNEVRIQQSFQEGTSENNVKNMRINDSIPAILKNEVWAFQNECRFILKLLPVSFTDGMGKNHETADLIEHLSFEKQYFDIEILAGMFSKMEITLGPNSTQADQLIIQSLLNEYAPDAKLTISTLKGKIAAR